ncbi:metalloprotease [Neomegalonema perideroedes]|uniref:metalloprotease n=1 Tax=Neomegalonema perideroedes TaxID=217219 RepID=UPI00036200ED|nr:hypothetical protein [Neomegalonema perideroedes]
MRQETRNDLILAVLFFAVVTMLTGSWILALLFMFALGWHEYGHVLAFRQAGHKRVRWRFIPFLGAVAWSGAPTRSQVERLYIALMGPGFSLVLLVLCLLAREMVPVGSQESWLLSYAVLTIGMLNAVNLLPLWPLDGSHVLRAMLAGWAPPGLARSILIASGGLLVILAAIKGLFVISIFASLQIMALIRFESEADEAAVRLLTPQERRLGAVAYFATLGAHGLAGWPFIASFTGLDAFL